MENFSSNKEEWVTFRDENEYEETYQRGIEIAKEEGMQDGISQGIEQGTIQNKIEIVKNMLKEEMNISLISKLTTLSIEKIKQIQKEIEI